MTGLLAGLGPQSLPHCPSRTKSEPTRFADTASGYLSISAIDTLLKQGSQLAEFKNSLGGLSVDDEGSVSLDTKQFDPAVSALKSSIELGIQSAFARSPMANQQTGFGVTPFAIDTGNASFVPDFTAALEAPLLRQRMREKPSVTLDIRNCFKPDPELQNFRVSIPVAKHLNELPASFATKGAWVYDSLSVSACIDFSNFTSQGPITRICRPVPEEMIPQPRDNRPGSRPQIFQSPDFFDDIRGDYIFGRPNPQLVGYYVESSRDGYGEYRSGERPQYACFRYPPGWSRDLRSGFKLPVLGTVDGVEENSSVSNGRHYTMNNVGGNIKINVTIASKLEGEIGTTKLTYSLSADMDYRHLDHDDPARSCAPPNGYGTPECRRARLVVIEKLHKVIQEALNKAASDGTIKSGVELPETLACKVRSDLQREGIEELQALVNEGATALGQQFSDFEDLKKAFVNYLLYAGYENLIGRVSNEDRDELVDIFMAIVAASPFDEDIISKVMQDGCNGHPILGDPKRGTLAEQISEAYQADLVEKLGALELLTSQIRVCGKTNSIIADLEVERQLRRLRELRSWIQLSTEVNLLN